MTTGKTTTALHEAAGGTPFPARYVVATVLLLGILVGAYTIVVARQHRGEMERELAQQGLVLLDSVGASVSHAMASTALIEDLIGQRLLDNARLIDRLIAAQGYDPARIQQIAAQNHLRKIQILDSDGKPLEVPPAAPSSCSATARASARDVPVPMTMARSSTKVNAEGPRPRSRSRGRSAGRDSARRIGEA